MPLFLHFKELIPLSDFTRYLEISHNPNLRNKERLEQLQEVYKQCIPRVTKRVKKS